MNIKTLAQAALATIIAAHPETVVTVVANGKTASAVKDTGTSDADLQVDGEKGLTTGRVRCNADTIGTVNKGQHITVAGAGALVTATRTDPVEAILTIEYQLERPVTFSDDVQ